MKKKYLYISLLALVALLSSCTSTKNTKATRWYHSFNTRYNIYFNGSESFNEALKNQITNHQDNYSQMILMYPVSALPKDKSQAGGPFDRAIEKSVKAIKRHSIQTKPEKKSGRSRDPKYIEFMSRTEYNPFLHNSWMMMAQSQFYNGDFLVAASSFSYISRLYSTQPEISLAAKIWQARCYGEMEWFYEAEDILTKANNDQLPKKLNGLLSSVLADVLIKQKRYQEAIPYLEIAIKNEKNKYQRTREKYLLGQIYARLGQRELAYKTFGSVSSANAPYILEFNAKIRQTEVYPGGDTAKIIRQLSKMAKSRKNKDYLDQLYYAMGNVYMAIPDTAKAVYAYEKGVSGSVQNGKEKALNQIQLGDIYFAQREYAKAQPNYSEALGQMVKEDAAYPRVAKRSEVLDELVLYSEAVKLQDSLLVLSAMSDEQRLAVAERLAEEYIQKEKDAEKAREREEYLARQDDLRAEQQSQQRRPNTGMGTPTNPQDQSTFYFYNQQAVTAGKNSFQQKWGRRTLEDNWRLREKSNLLLDNSSGLPDEEEFVEEVITDSIADGGAEVEVLTDLSDDPRDPQFYLQQIPVTEEDIAAAHLIIADGLYNMAMIYKDKLEDYSLAIETFLTLESRYPDFENMLEAYYQTYLTYWRVNRMDMAEVYKNKIRTRFPESDYAIAMANPDYEYNLKMTQVIQDSLYNATFNAYLNSNMREVRRNYSEAVEKYGNSYLMPKFMFLNAFTYLPDNDAEGFKEALKALIEKYPQEDVSVLASEMMKRFQRGLVLSSSGSSMLARGNVFNMVFASDSLTVVADSTVQFSAEKNTPYQLMLLYSTQEIDENLFLFTVASFNFGNFMVNDFGLEKTAFGDVGLLKVTGFNNLAEALQYLSMIEQPGVFGYELDEQLIKVPISEENYNLLTRGKTLNEYMEFFESHFYEAAEGTILKWDLKKDEEQEIEQEINVEQEEQKTEENNIEQEIEEDKIEEEIEVKQETKVEEKIEEEITIEQEEEKIEEHNVEEEIEIEQEQEQEQEEQEVIEEQPEEEEVKNVSTMSIEEYVKWQEKEEKKRKQAEEKARKEQEKIDRKLEQEREKERKALLKQQQEEEKALLKAKKKQEADLQKMKDAERKKAEQERKRLAKEKEDLRKQQQKEKEDARKQRDKEREAERKAKEKARKEAQKEKEQARKEREKQLKAEREAKEKARKEEQKRKEEERRNRSR